jgi:hypothetical protein
MLSYYLLYSPFSFFFVLVPYIRSFPVERNYYGPLSRLVNRFLTSPITNREPDLATFLRANRPANLPSHLRGLDFLGWGWNVSVMNGDDEAPSRPVSPANQVPPRSQLHDDDSADTDSSSSSSNYSPPPSPSESEPPIGAGLILPHRARGIYVWHFSNCDFFVSHRVIVC